MSLGKRLFIGEAAAACTTDSVNPFTNSDSPYTGVALYQLDGNANDTVGSHNGTATNITYSTGQFGNAAVFNGSSSRISIPSTATAPVDVSTGTFSISMWVNMDNLTNNNKLVYKWGSSAATRNFLFNVLSSSGYLFFIEGSTGGDVVRTGTFALSANTWHHITLTRKQGGSLKMYVDGDLKDTFAATGTFKTSTEPIYLGYQLGQSTNFTGKIDQVRIYEKEISSDEVGILYNETTSTASDTNVLGEGSGLALYSLDYDASDAGGNHDGTPNDVTFGVDGQVNWGASFNGSSSYIEISTENTGLTLFDRTNYSISVWYYTSNVTTSGRVFSQEDGGGSVIAIRGDDFVIDTRDVSGSGASVVTPFSSSNNAWNHVVLTYDGTTYKLYLNGNQTPAATYAHSLYPTHATASSGYRMALGARRASGSTSSLFDGVIDQARLFSKTLSPAEVSTLYGETACVYTSTTDTLDYQGTNLAYYKLDGNALDETSNNYDGAESNITYEFGRYGTAAVFNGSSSKIEFTPDSNFVNDFTISAWINMNQLPVSSYLYQVVSWGDEATGERRSLGIWNGGSGDPKVYFSGYGASANFGGNTSVSANQWYHICVTRSGSTVKVYLNGSPDGTGTVTLNYYTGTTGRIGASGSAQEFFNGSIDQVRIFGSALDDTAVENLYNEKQAYITKDASDPFGDNSEEAFYKLENNANDSTGSNNGTWSGTPAYITGVFGQGADFNGTNRIDTGITSNYSNYTISLWAKKDAGGEKYIIQKGYYVSSSNNNFTVIGQNSSGNLFVYNRLNTTTNLYISGIIPNTGEWFHLVVTKDSSNVNTIYYNGVKQTTSSPSPANSSSDEWQIGGGNLSGGWDGGVDQVRIFDRALDGDEVFKLYAEHIN